MVRQSLHKNGFLHILRFSVLYSIIIATILTIVSLKSLRHEKEQQVIDRIQSFLNSYEGSSLSKNFPLIVQNLQQRTSLQEILIYDEKCNLLAGSVLTVKNICLDNQDFKSLNVFFAQSRFKIFYNYNYSIRDHILRLDRSSLYWLCGIFLITASLLYTFLHFTMMRPLREIGKNLNQSKSLSIPKELNFFESKIMELKKEILKSEEERTYYRASKKVIHDIRNPLLHLRKLIEDGTFSCQELLEKLNDVDFQIRSVLTRNEASIHEVSLQSFFESLKKDLLLMFNLDLEFSK
jgi:hypothetical protein